MATIDQAGSRTRPDTPPAGIHRRLYDWVLQWADTPYGVPALFVLSFAESSFFPIPPDVLLLALGVGRPQRAFWFATVCSIASILGGLLGYAIGYFAWGAFQEAFFAYVPGFSPEVFARVQGLYDEYGFLAVMIAGFTPIPFKVFTVASGVFGMNVPVFVLASAFSRTLRFFIEGVLMYYFGERIQEIMDRYFNLITVAFLALLVGGFAAIRFLH